MINFEEDLPAVAPISDEQLGQIAALAQKQLALEEQVANLKASLSDAEGQLRHVSQLQLPEAMVAVGMTEFKLTDGTKISIKSDISCTITEANRLAAMTWLRSNGLEDIIKNEVRVPLGKKSDELLERVAEALAALDVEWTRKEEVHPQTLKATLKEVMANGVDVPFDTFSGYPYNKATVKVPKK